MNSNRTGLQLVGVKLNSNERGNNSVREEYLENSPFSPESILSSESEGSGDENWEEEWGAVTIQSLVRGYAARKRVKRIKKRRRRGPGIIRIMFNLQEDFSSI